MEGYITIGEFYENPVFTSGTTIIFDSDEAFEDFCVDPVARIRYSSEGEPVSCGGAYTEMYTKCIKAGMKFLIRDRQSKVYKRNVVTKRVLVPSELRSSRKDVAVQLRVQNLVSPGVLKYDTIEIKTQSENDGDNSSELSQRKDCKESDNQ